MIDENAPFTSPIGRGHDSHPIQDVTLDTPPCMYVYSGGQRCTATHATQIISVGPHEFAMCDCHAPRLIEMLGLAYEGYRALVGRMEIGMRPWDGPPLPPPAPSAHHNCQEQLAYVKRLRSGAYRGHTGGAAASLPEPTARDDAADGGGLPADPAGQRPAARGTTPPRTRGADSGAAR